MLRAISQSLARSENIAGVCVESFQTMCFDCVPRQNCLIVSLPLGLFSGCITYSEVSDSDSFSKKPAVMFCCWSPRVTTNRWSAVTLRAMNGHRGYQLLDRITNSTLSIPGFMQLYITNRSAKLLSQPARHNTYHWVFQGTMREPTLRTKIAVQRRLLMIVVWLVFVDAHSRTHFGDDWKGSIIRS